MRPMLRKTLPLLIALVITAPIALTQTTMGGAPFSADMAVTTKNGAKTNGKIFSQSQKMRMEMTAQGQPAAMIFDGDKQTGYMLMPQQKMYMEMNANSAAARGMQTPNAKQLDPKNPCAADATLTCKKVGTETVNGRTTDHWEIAEKNGGVSHVWIDPKLHFPIKATGSDGNSLELTNVQEGAQPAHLFEPPSDYRKFDMGGMMQGMPGGAPPQR